MLLFSRLPLPLNRPWIDHLKFLAAFLLPFATIQPRLHCSIPPFKRLLLPFTTIQPPLNYPFPLSNRHLLIPVQIHAPFVLLPSPIPTGNRRSSSHHIRPLWAAVDISGNMSFQRVR